MNWNDFQFEKEIYDLVGPSWRLKTGDQVVAISRTMLQAETISQRVMLLQVRISRYKGEKPSVIYRGGV